MSDRQLYTRYCEIKEEMKKMRLELKQIRPQIENLLSLAKGTKKKVQVKLPEFSPQVIEFSTSSRKRTLNLALIKECLDIFLKTNTLTPTNIDEFLELLVESRASGAVETQRLSYKKQKFERPTTTTATTTEDDADVVRY